MVEEFYKIIRVLNKKVQIKRVNEELNIEIEEDLDEISNIQIDRRVKEMEK